MNRTKEIIETIGERLENGMYIDGDFLVENNISSDELLTIETIGTIIKGISKLSSNEIYGLIMLGQGVEPAIVESIMNEIDLKTTGNELIKKLKEL